MSALLKPQRWPILVDRTAAAAAFACALHCAVTPWLIGLAPLIGLGFLFDHLFEQVFVVLAAVVALSSLIPGLLNHRSQRPLLTAIAGLGLMFTGSFSELHANLVSHAVLLASGGALLAWAHWQNQQRLAAG